MKLKELREKILNLPSIATLYQRYVSRKDVLKLLDEYEKELNVK